jgi:hypothetical protein
VHAGTYRLRHFGDYKHIFGGTQPFNGTSSSFRVRTPAPPPAYRGRRGGLSDWEQYVRSHGFMIPLALFAAFLALSVAFRGQALGVMTQQAQRYLRVPATV